MGSLKYHIKSKEDFEKFQNLLLLRLKNNEYISENPMIDGFIISFITYNKFVYDLFLNTPSQWVLDGSMQQLEQVVIWLINNEDELIKILQEKL